MPVSKKVQGFMEQGGWIRTRAFTWPGGELAVNADTRRRMSMDRRFCSGRIRVEVLDEAGVPTAGFRREDCQPFTGDTNGESRVVEWCGGKRLAELAGRSVSFVFILESANLYAFESLR